MECQCPACTEIEAKARGYKIYKNPLDRHLHEVVNVSWNFAKRCETKEDEILNAVLGLGGEAGEVVDTVKKYRFHTPKPLEFFRAKIVLELGDVLYYVCKIMDLFNISLEEVLEGNRKKLESRHPEHGKVKERFSGDYIK